MDTPASCDAASTPCGHSFCTDCILEWLETQQESAAPTTPGGDRGVEGGTCPVCKAPVGGQLMVRRQLDGQQLDAPVAESVVLLLRASWRRRRGHDVTGLARGLGAASIHCREAEAEEEALLCRARRCRRGGPGAYDDDGGGGGGYYLRGQRRWSLRGGGNSGGGGGGGGGRRTATATARRASAVGTSGGGVAASEGAKPARGGVPQRKLKKARQLAKAKAKAKAKAEAKPGAQPAAPLSV
jgi:hypothetical protein